MHVVCVNYACASDLTDPEALLARYTTLTGWSEALLAAGAERVTVVQRFGRDAEISRNAVRYVFRRGGSGSPLVPWAWPGNVHRAILEARPDVVHVNGLNFPWQTWLLRKALCDRTSLVVQDHGGDQPAAPESAALARLRSAVRAGALGADACFFTAAAEGEARKRAGLLPAHLRICQVMEASTTIRPVDRAYARQAASVDGHPAVLWVGRLNPNKDPLTALDGFERALDQLPDARLTMVYSADHLATAVAQRLRRSQALGRAVRLAGRVSPDQMAAFYSAADLFLLGSHHEGSGYALIEAMACGVVPVVTDIPTFRVITAGGTLGSLWKVADSTDCSRALRDAGRLDLATLRRSIREHFDRALSWAAVGRQAIAAYRTVMSGRVVN